MSRDWFTELNRITEDKRKVSNRILVGLIVYLAAFGYGVYWLVSKWL